MQLGLGIDTGNTNTDSVLVDLASGRVLQTAKALTTPTDLLAGILASVDQVMCGIDPQDVALVAVSTTLATNAVVEGRGSSIALIVIGWDPQAMVLPQCQLICVDGLMNARGDEQIPLDKAGLRAALRALPIDTEAIAISGYFSVRNPAHEGRAKEIAREETGLPVVCGHELASELGMYERTVTATLNARITPLVNRFLSDVHLGMNARGITAPIMVMRSDGSLVPEQYAMGFPVQTILSGPAASAVGGAGLSSISNGTIVDIGGTTTDIVSVNRGLPILDDAGANVGGWRTRVRGVKAWVTGLGGDSHVRLFTNGFETGYTILPRRVVPIAFGNVRSDYADSPDDPDSVEQLNRVTWPVGGLSESAAALGKLIPDSGISLNRLERLGRDQGAYLVKQSLMELEDSGSVSHTGFTPSDALHSVEQARTAAAILGKPLGLSAEQFAESVVERFQARLTEEILKDSVSDELPRTDFAHNPLWQFMKEPHHPKLKIEISLSSPIVGLGAPVDAYLPPVCSKLTCPYVRCPQSGTGSAYGAITGKMVSRIDAIVRKQASDRFLIFLPDKRLMLERSDDQMAMSYAYESALALARKRVEELGSDDVHTEVREKTYRLGLGKVSVIAIGVPHHSAQTATVARH